MCALRVEAWVVVCLLAERLGGAGSRLTGWLPTACAPSLAQQTKNAEQSRNPKRSPQPQLDSSFLTFHSFSPSSGHLPPSLRGLACLHSFLPFRPSLSHASRAWFEVNGRPRCSSPPRARSSRRRSPSASSSAQLQLSLNVRLATRPPAITTRVACSSGAMAMRCSRAGSEPVEWSRASATCARGGQ